MRPDLGFLAISVVKNPLANAGDAGLIHGSGRRPGEGNGNPLQYSMDTGARWTTVPGIKKELDMTERLHFHFSLSCIGEGNGNPLQCCCLENPRDGEPGGLPSMGSHRVGHD